MTLTSQSYDVVVVGLGAMGGACAAHLARRGARVLGLDRFTPPHSHGSSHGRTRIIRETYFEDPLYIPLVRRSLALWRELEEETGTELLTIAGALVMGPRDSEILGGTLASLAEHDVEHTMLGLADVRVDFPAVNAEAGAWAIYEPGAGVLNVEACVAAHLRSATEAGADLRLGQPATQWRDDRYGVTVETHAGTYRARSLVLATGAWMPEQIPTLPLVVERQVQVWFEPVTGAGFRVGESPVYLFHTIANEFLYVIPDMGHGVKAALHHGGTVAPREELDREVSPADVGSVRNMLAELVPAAAGRVLDASVCFYTNTPDHHFLIDRLPDHHRILIVSPCSGHGFKFAPVIGERVADWILDDPSDGGLSEFSVSRFRPGDS